MQLLQCWYGPKSSIPISISLWMEDHAQLSLFLCYNVQLATRGSKLGQRSPKGHQFWTLTQQVCTTSLNWIVWIIFQIMFGNNHFDQFSVILGPLGGIIGPTSPERESVLNTHQRNAYTKFEILRLLFQIMFGNPKRMDRRTLTIPMSPPDLVGGDKNNNYVMKLVVRPVDSEDSHAFDSVPLSSCASKLQGALLQWWVHH